MRDDAASPASGIVDTPQPHLVVQREHLYSLRSRFVSLEKQSLGSGFRIAGRSNRRDFLGFGTMPTHKTNRDQLRRELYYIEPRKVAVTLECVPETVGRY